MEFSMTTRFLSKLGLAFVVCAGLTSTGSLANDVITLQLDRATVIRAPNKTTTMVVGNPAIADVSIQKNGVIVLTAKSYGETNLLALDSEGQLVSETWLKVQASIRGNMVITRGVERETHSCTPNCVPTMTLGDNQKYFSEAGGQAGIRNSNAVSSSAGQPAQSR
jgi:Pilus formation protein N terminal region